MTSSVAEFDPTVFENFDFRTIVFKDDTNDREDQEPEDEPKSESVDFVPSKQATTFVIDCSTVPLRELPQKLFEKQKIIKSEDEDTLLLSNQERSKETSIWQEIFESISSFMRGRIIASKFDKVGVVLYGTSSIDKAQDISTSNDAAFPGIEPLLDLDFLSAKGIKLIEKQQTETFRSFTQKHSQPKDNDGKKLEPKLGDLFWYLNQVFIRCSNLRQYNNRVVLITANDNPCPCKEDRTAALQRGRDLREGIADVDFIPVQIQGLPDFDFSIFYQEFFSDQFSLQELIQHSTKLKNLVPDLKKTETTQRVLNQVPFELWDAFKISMNVYTSVLAQRPPAPYFIDMDTKKPLQTVTQYLCEVTGELLVDEQIKKYIPFAEDRVFITKEEKQKLGHFRETDGQPHLRLLGFKPVERLKLHHTIKHPYFVYPNDTTPPYGVKGGASVVAALLTSMHEKKVFAVCRFVPRTNAMPRICALLPQLEGTDEEGNVLCPPGFHLIVLPFADDLRHLDLTQSQSEMRDSDQGKERSSAAAKLLKKMRLSFFDPYTITNPAIQKHYAGLEAFALGQKQVEETIDIMNSVEGYEKIIPLAKTYMDLLVQQCGPISSKAIASSATSPRRNEMKSSGTADIITLYECGKLSSLLVNQLKQFCQEKGLPVSGKKADLVERIAHYFQRKEAIKDSAKYVEDHAEEDEDKGKDKLNLPSFGREFKNVEQKSKNDVKPQLKKKRTK